MSDYKKNSIDEFIFFILELFTEAGILVIITKYTTLGGYEMIGSSVTAKRICDLTDTHLISINGSLFFYGLALELKKHVDQITEKKNSKVILDLSGCPIADAGGLGEIVRSYTKILRNDGSIVMVNPGKKMRGMFKLTKLDEVFEITDDIETAVNMFSNGHKAVGKAATL